MIPLTYVFHLEKGTWHCYMLPHKLALVCCYEQTKPTPNFNTWTYRPIREYPIHRGKHTLRLGDVSVFTDRCPLL